MWGKEAIKGYFRAMEGITPTHVGKSSRLPKRRERYRDHPHPCGEKDALAEIEYYGGGSPPPMWGKENEYMLMPSRYRITPTHVGKS